MEVLCIKKILAQNLLIYVGLHCVNRSLLIATTLATLVGMNLNKMQIQLNRVSAHFTWSSLLTVFIWIKKVVVFSIFH